MAISRRSGRTAVCTIVARNYFAQARSLFESLAQYGSADVDCFVLLTDHTGPAPYSEVSGFQELTLAEISEFLPTLEKMKFQYQVVEFATAVKPSLLRYLLESKNYDHAVYFDPDILVTGSLSGLIQELQSGSVFLTPHILKGIPEDGLRPTEKEILISGCFNLGFIGVANQPKVHSFLKWWEFQLKDLCVWRPDRGLFVDQRWIDLVPCFFGDLKILRSPAYNAAFWNLHERPISFRDGRFFAADVPLAFFHFSGFDPLQPDQLSRHQSRQALTPSLRRLLETYRDFLSRNGFEDHHRVVYGHDRFDNGLRIPEVARRLLMRVGGVDRFGNPFSTLGTESFFSWMLVPEGVDALPPLLEQIWLERTDVQRALSGPEGRSLSRFWEWFERFGASEFRIEETIVRLLKINFRGPQPLATPGDGLGRHP